MSCGWCRYWKEPKVDTPGHDDWEWINRSGACWRYPNEKTTRRSYVCGEFAFGSNATANEEMGLLASWWWRLGETRREANKLREALRDEKRRHANTREKLKALKS